MKSIATSRKPEFPAEFPDMKRKIEERKRQAEAEEIREENIARYNKRFQQHNKTGGGIVIHPSKSDFQNTRTCFFCHAIIEQGVVARMLGGAIVCNKCWGESYGLGAYEHMRNWMD